MSNPAAAEAPAEEKMLGFKNGPIAEIVFNNPARHNAVSLDMWERMTALLADFAADPAVRALVVSGAGGKAFVSGADISKFESQRSTPEAVAHYNATWLVARRWNTMARSAARNASSKAW